MALSAATAVTGVAAGSKRFGAFSLFVANCCLFGTTFCQAPPYAESAEGTSFALAGLV